MNNLTNPLAPLIAELAKFGGFTEEKATELANILLPYIDEYVDQALHAQREQILAALPSDEILTTKYGYNLDGKKFGFRIAMTEVRQVIEELNLGKTHGEVWQPHKDCGHPRCLKAWRKQ